MNNTLYINALCNVIKSGESLHVHWKAFDLIAEQVKKDCPDAHNVHRIAQLGADYLYEMWRKNCGDEREDTKRRARNANAILEQIRNTPNI